MGRVSESRLPESPGFRNILIFRPMSSRKRLVQRRYAEANVIVDTEGIAAGHVALHLKQVKAAAKPYDGRTRVGKRINLSRRISVLPHDASGLYMFNVQNISATKNSYHVSRNILYQNCDMITTISNVAIHCVM